ncbi:MAG: purine-binding chemotaxis protein CheW [Rhodospirillaceae bacterium]|nr:MAG: purine-binding chemotaxis protein CheW [Rhodospirillaceae bacterium]
MSRVPLRIFLQGVTGSNRFCLPLEDVVRVFALVSLQSVPGASVFLKGVANIGGRSVPVVDLAQRIGLPSMTRYTLETPIVLCQTDDFLIGLIVETVAGLASFRACDIQLVDLFQDLDRSMAGIAVVAGQQTMVIDVRRLFGPGARHGQGS